MVVLLLPQQFPMWLLIHYQQHRQFITTNLNMLKIMYKKIITNGKDPSPRCLLAVGSQGWSRAFPGDFDVSFRQNTKWSI